jgi:protein-tyrosine phosphatase
VHIRNNPLHADIAVKKVSVLFVCMGNICRSPTAHGVFRHQVLELGLEHLIAIDSAGTHNYHPGSPPDARSLAHAAKRGYDLTDLRARQVRAADFTKFDLILVMDRDNLSAIQQTCPPQFHHKVRRLTDFCVKYMSDAIPDPYYGGAKGFEHVLDLVEDACDGLLHHLREERRQ